MNPAVRIQVSQFCATCVLFLPSGRLVKPKDWVYSLLHSCSACRESVSPISERKTKSHSMIRAHPPLRKTLPNVGVTAHSHRCIVLVPVHVSKIVRPSCGHDAAGNETRMYEVERPWLCEAVEAPVQVGNLKTSLATSTQFSSSMPILSLSTVTEITIRMHAGAF